MRRSIFLHHTGYGSDWAKSSKRQSGGIGIFGALVLGLAVLFTAVSIDTGRLMLEQRRLQKIADMAALDASSASGNCGDGTAGAADAAAQESAARNGYTGNLGSETNGILLGITDSSGGVRQFTPSDPDVATAVQVTTSSTVPASLVAGGIFGEQVTLSAMAVAERQAVAAFSAGSLLLSLDSKESAVLNTLLNGILGSSLSLDAIGYQGIANTSVKLLDLVNASADVGTVNELLNSDVAVSDLLQLYLDAVNSTGTADAQVITALGDLAAGVSSAAVHVGDVLNVTTPNPEDALNASVNLLDLITTTAIVANGTHALTLPLGINILGLSINSLLEVIEPPQIAIGPPGKDADGNWKTQVNTAQIRLRTDVTGDVPILPLVLKAKVDLGINLQVAQGSAWLESIQCSRLSNSNSVVKIGAQPGIASLSITKSGGVGPSGEIVTQLNSILFGYKDALGLKIGLNLPLQDANSTELSYDVDLSDSDSLPVTQRASSTLGGSLGNGLSELADSLVITTEILGALTLALGTILSLVISIVLEPVLSGLASALFDPLLSILGIEVGNLDVQLIDVEMFRPELLI